jgi:hypothetical protein
MQIIFKADVSRNWMAASSLKAPIGFDVAVFHPSLNARTFESSCADEHLKALPGSIIRLCRVIVERMEMEKSFGIRSFLASHK